MSFGGSASGSALGAVDGAEEGVGAAEATGVLLVVGAGPGPSVGDGGFVGVAVCVGAGGFAGVVGAGSQPADRTAVTTKGAASTRCLPPARRESLLFRIDTIVLDLTGARG